MKTTLLFGIMAASLSLSAMAQTNLVGTTAPASVLVTFDGQYRYLSRIYYDGPDRPRAPRSAVALNFMGLRCEPCRRALPVFMQVVKGMAEDLRKDKELFPALRYFVVNIDPLSAKEQLRRYLTEMKINPMTEVLLDPYRRAAHQFGVTGIPRTFVISPRGRIAADITGFPDDYKSLLQSGIEEALKDGEGK